MGTLADLQARIADDLFRQDMTAQIASRINSAISFYADTRFWFNQRTVMGQTVVGSQYVPIPPGLETLDTVMINAGGSNEYELIYRSRETIERWYGTTTFNGQPTDFTWDDATGQFRLWGNPNAIYPLAFVGIFDEPALVSPTDANVWTTDFNAVDLIAARVCYLVNRDVIKDVTSAGIYKAAETEARQNCIRKEVMRHAVGGVRASFGSPR